MIEQGRELRIENVLSLRKKVLQNELNTEMAKIGNFLSDNSPKKVGPIVTATFAVEAVNEQPLLDMEILVPIDKTIESSSEYHFKKPFQMIRIMSSYTYTKYRIRGVCL